MKIDLTSPILDEKNQPIPDMTLRTICAQALFAALPADADLSAVKKGELGFLGLQISHLDEIDLKSEQITMLKERIGKCYTNLVIYRAHALLDPPAEAVRPKPNGAMADQVPGHA